MSITNTITSMATPFVDLSSDRTRTSVEWLQTQASGATMGVYRVFKTCTAADDFYISYLGVSLSDPTAAALATVYFGTQTAHIFATAATGPWSFYYGEPGLNIQESTLTNSVSIVTTGGTVTVSFIAKGYRKL